MLVIFCILDDGYERKTCMSYKKDDVSVIITCNYKLLAYIPRTV